MSITPPPPSANQPQQPNFIDSPAKNTRSGRQANQTEIQNPNFPAHVQVDDGGVNSDDEVVCVGSKKKPPKKRKRLSDEDIWEKSDKEILGMY